MFKCKVCDEKNKRIAELKDQIAHLRLLVYPQNDALVGTDTPPDIDSAELSESDSIEQFQDVQQKERYEVEAERDRLLSGQY